MTEPELQEQFERLCQFDQLSREQAERLLLQLATAFLKHNFTPSCSCLTGIALQRGGYLLELFCTIYPIAISRKQELSSLLQALRQQLANSSLVAAPVSFYPNDTAGYDEVAQDWGLTNGMRPAQVRGFLDLQRRVNLR